MIKWWGSHLPWSQGHTFPRPKSYLVLSLFYLFVLCFSVSFFSCLFPCNLMWGCSLWQIKGSHLWSVSFPQTKWEVRRDDLQHAYQRERESQGDRNVLTDLDREMHGRKYNRNEQLKTRGGFVMIVLLLIFKHAQLLLCFSYSSGRINPPPLISSFVYLKNKFKILRKEAEHKHIWKISSILLTLLTLFTL